MRDQHHFACVLDHRLRKTYDGFVYPMCVEITLPNRADRAAIGKKVRREIQVLSQGREASNSLTS
jgi:hypothetical protein